MPEDFEGLKCLCTYTRNQELATFSNHSTARRVLQLVGFFLKSCASKNLFWSHIEWESFLSNSTDFITIIYYQTMRMTLVWEQKLHLFIRKYCKGYTYVEGTMACSGLFTNTWICPNVSCKTRVGRFNLHSLSRVVVVHILKLLTVEKFQTSNTRKKIGYLYQGVYVAMDSMDFILIKHNGNYKMEKPTIY